VVVLLGGYGVLNADAVLASGMDSANCAKRYALVEK